MISTTESMPRSYVAQMLNQPAFTGRSPVHGLASLYWFARLFQDACHDSHVLSYAALNPRFAFTTYHASVEKFS